MGRTVVPRDRGTSLLFTSLMRPLHCSEASDGNKYEAIKTLAIWVLAPSVLFYFLSLPPHIWDSYFCEFRRYGPWGVVGGYLSAPHSHFSVIKCRWCYLVTNHLVYLALLFTTMKNELAGATTAFNFVASKALRFKLCHEML